ncbi:hypothetical protein SNEBB_002537 [Seison nebaliae]|nr:hypothetical protein SNEBB_002537 [Seison nebaliae]
MTYFQVNSGSFIHQKPSTLNEDESLKIFENNFEDISQLCQIDNFPSFVLQHQLNCFDNNLTLIRQSIKRLIEDDKYRHFQVNVGEGKYFVLMKTNDYLKYIHKKLQNLLNTDTISLLSCQRIKYVFKKLKNGEIFVREQDLFNHDINPLERNLMVKYGFIQMYSTGKYAITIPQWGSISKRIFKLRQTIIKLIKLKQFKEITEQEFENMFESANSKYFNYKFLFHDMVGSHMIYRNIYSSKFIELFSMNKQPFVYSIQLNSGRNRNNISVHSSDTFAMTEEKDENDVLYDTAIIIPSKTATEAFDHELDSELERKRIYRSFNFRARNEPKVVRERRIKLYNKRLQNRRQSKQVNSFDMWLLNHRKIVVVLLILIVLLLVGVTLLTVFLIKMKKRPMEIPECPSVSTISDFDPLLVDCAIDFSEIYELKLNSSQSKTPDILTEDICISRGCCWIGNVVKYYRDYSGKNIHPLPRCIYPNNYGYEIDTMKNESHRKISGTINRLNIPLSFTINDYEKGRFFIEQQSNNRIRVVIEGYNPKSFIKHRWHVPHPISPDNDFHSEDVNYSINIIEKPFQIEIRRLSNNATIFDTRNTPIILSDQFNEFTTSLPPAVGFYGFGEHAHSKLNHLPFNRERWPIFANGNNKISDGINHHELFSHIPMYLVVEEDRSSHIVFLRNTNAQDVTLSQNARKRSVTWRTLGGILDIIIIMGNCPKSALQEFHRVIGYPMMPALWSIGFQMGHAYYKNLTYLAEVYDENVRSGVRITGLHCGMETARNGIYVYTVGEEYKKFNSVSNNLLKNGTRMVIEIVPQLPVSPVGHQPYAPWINLEAPDKLWILDNFKPIAISIPGKETDEPESNLVDYTHPEVLKQIMNSLLELSTLSSLGGLYMNKNEPTVDAYMKNESYCSYSKYNEPPYNPIDRKIFYHGSVCMDARLHLSYFANIIGYYGHAMSEQTFNAVRAISVNRTTLFTRSAFLGTGKYAGKIIDNLKSSWKDFRQSIILSMEFSLFGFSAVGSDVCGSYGVNVDPELCTRWMQAAAFMPIFRNYYYEVDQRHDPASFEEPYRSSMVDAVEWRVSLINHIYTLYWLSHQYGDMIMRPIWVNYPNETTVFDIDDEWMLGESLLIVPILEPRAKRRLFYLPKGTWYDLHNVLRYDIDHSNHQQRIDIVDINRMIVFMKSGSIIIMSSIQEIPSLQNQAILDDNDKSRLRFPINFHSKGGRGSQMINIVGGEETYTYPDRPKRSAGKKNVKRSTPIELLKSQKLLIIIALNEKMIAKGCFFFDNGDSAIMSSDNYRFITYQFKPVEGKKYLFELHMVSKEMITTHVNYDSITIYGFPKRPLWMKVNNNRRDYLSTDTWNEAKKAFELTLSYYKLSEIDMDAKDTIIQFSLTD